MMDDREFDRLLEEEAEHLPLSELEVEAITPWRQAMERIAWGLGLTTLKLNFLGLNILLPAVGMVMLLLGFRTLRRENHWFRACWLVSLWRTAREFVSLVAQATLWNTVEGTRLWVVATGIGLTLIQVICLWQGIRAVRRKAGQPDRAETAGHLVAWNLVLCVLGLAEVQLGLLGWGVIIAYICVLRNLHKLSALLDGAGYQVQAAQVRVNDGAVWIAWFAALAVCIFLAAGLWGHYPMEWTPRASEAGTEAEEIREALMELGLPEDIAADLSPADLAAMEGALSVSGKVEHHDLLDGPANGLRATDIAVELPGGNWRIIHHFRWETEPRVRGTDCIQIWPATKKFHYELVGEYTGQLLYDREGTTYTGDFYRIEDLNYSYDSLLWGARQSYDVFAEFSFPRRGENLRGYVTYGIRPLNEGKLIDSWSNYIHQHSRFNYPFVSARQYGMGYGSSAFDKENSAIQIIPGEQGFWDIHD